MTIRIIIQDGWSTEDVTDKVTKIIDELPSDWQEYMDDWEVEFILDTGVRLGLAGLESQLREHQAAAARRAEIRAEVEADHERRKAEQARLKAKREAEAPIVRDHLHGWLIKLGQRIDGGEQI